MESLKRKVFPAPPYRVEIVALHAFVPMDFAIALPECTKARVTAFGKVLHYASLAGDGNKPATLAWFVSYTPTKKSS